MRLRTSGGIGFGSGFRTLGLLLALGAALTTTPADAAKRGGYSGSHGGNHYAGRGSAAHKFAGSYYGRKYAYHSRLQCVTFARSDTGIELSGNASAWWENAAGVYQRGQRPEAGAVLAFSANGRMRLGHVAVVSRVVGPREIEIDHANWWGPGSYGGVTRGVSVVDVSERNDWTAVRVALGRGEEFGSIYPTHGFIYGRADREGGAVINASAQAPAAPVPALNPPPADLRPAYARSESGTVADDEVADLPSEPRGHWRRHYRGHAAIPGGRHGRVAHAHRPHRFG
jgi:surface antigen